MGSGPTPDATLSQPRLRTTPHKFQACALRQGTRPPSGSRRVAEPLTTHRGPMASFSAAQEVVSPPAGPSYTCSKHAGV
ncbi:hypothetical protein NDU88_005168 [Pleurodeles waltl]|uniref:Uncharacterized protein n=1 Tax=Pleurodeles waltl TaxID=8319 RepID=A0AAV7UHA0_PLEWA|nr:hypothetical protein NDU88_005168 [Pleurodeles waltl]